MGAFRVAAFVLFVFAAVAGFGWGVGWSLQTIAGLIAAGLACLTASFLTIPQPPPSR